MVWWGEIRAATYYVLLLKLRQNETKKFCSPPLDQRRRFFARPPPPAPPPPMRRKTSRVGPACSPPRPSVGRPRPRPRPAGREKGSGKKPGELGRFFYMRAQCLFFRRLTLCVRRGKRTKKHAGVSIRVVGTLVLGNVLDVSAFVGCIALLDAF